MAIYPYTLPAILAFISKIAILVLSLRAERRNLQTRLFVFALLSSMAINIAEIIVLQKLIVPDLAVVLHFVAHIMMLALLVQLAISMSFDELSAKLFPKIRMVIYGYTLLLEGLVIFTSLVISGAEPLGGYTYTRIPGPLYWIYELFVVTAMLAITLLPAWGLRQQDIAARNRCKLWVVLSAPLAVLVLVIVGLLHFGLHWFNVTVTTPLLIALFLAAVGYAVHHHHPIDLNFYLPGSCTKKSKTKLYDQLDTFNRVMPRFRTLSGLLEEFGAILRCPVALIDQHAVLHDTSADAKLSNFPLSALHDMRRMTVANEIHESDSRLHASMTQYGAAAIVPLFPHSNTARHWLLLGEPFSRLIYMPRDFREIERLLGRIAGLLLDKLLQTDEKPTPVPKVAIKRLKKSLPQSVAEFEAGLIRQALTSCHGNQAHAARLLGIRPNTLYYKIERYGLSSQPTT